MGEIYRLNKNPRAGASGKAKFILEQRLKNKFGESCFEFDIPRYLAQLKKDSQMQQSLRNQLSHPNRSRNTAKKTRLNRRPESRKIAWIEELETRQMRSVSDDSADLTIFGAQAGQRSGVAIVASGNNLVIGAYLSDVGWAADAGAVNIYNDSGALLQVLTKPVPVQSDLFGQALAASSDGAILVGAPLDNLGGTDSGAVYLYDSEGNLKSVFANPTPNLGDQFGSAVAFVGNDLVLIGAKGDDAYARDGGAAYLFDRHTAQLIATYYNPSPTMSDYFGNTVGALGDDIVIGSYYDDMGGFARSGAVYVFGAGASGATNSPRLTLANPTPATDDHFGISLATYGNYILIGCDGEDKGALDAGAAYLYDGKDGTLLKAFYNPAPALSDKFGNSVALDAGRALVGAQADDYGIINSGSAYLFDVESGTLTHEFHNPFAGLGDNFGSAVAFLASGNVAISAAGDDSGLLLDSGSVDVFVVN